ncbi:glycogen(starch) synthase [Bacillus sp. SORGH_AS 510]|uniref:glycosyltransferase family 4 protein n=1 Tax=Bacillus sp. SORGH_AS_0510 TaxID=3041771 RepID=UPI00277DA88C|nr:glycosyltransferase family 4 protein [Bacillus sp. SORGH_AS_0510]MDQ1145043.1 glycogen(starch) synthase [Bacillus sp. SORGH_AS_0510]
MNKTFSQQGGINCNPVERWNLKILMLCWEYPPNIVGGLSRHVAGLSMELAMLGHEVHVLTAGMDKLSAYENMNGVHVHRVQPINNRDEQFFNWIAGLNLAMAFKAERLAEEIPFDFIHAHDWLVGAAAITLNETLSIPLVTTIHATEHGRNNGIHNQMQQFVHEKEQQLIAKSNHIIVCSDYMKDDLLSIFKANEAQISVIPNGVEPVRPAPPARVTFPEFHNKKYIFSLGRIVKEKGFETLIKAAEISKVDGLDYLFVVAGKGPMLETYRQQISAKKLESHIKFIGYISDEQRNSLIQESVLAVIPSLYEPFGIVALETMGFGKPTIVSNTGGMKGIVKHLQTGILTAPGDARRLLEQIDFLIKNPKKAQEIGEKGRQIVLSLYSWKRIASETNRVMEDLLLNVRVGKNEKEEQKIIRK